MVVGNEKGQVGVGVGKAGDVIGAVKKGVADGKKHLVDVPLTRSYSIPHPSNGIGGGAKVFMRPRCPPVPGLLLVEPCAPYWNWLAFVTCWPSSWVSNNPLNNARAAANALAALRTFSESS